MGGGTEHNCTDSRTEVFCLEMREGVIITSILAICKAGGLQSIIALILALKYFVWRWERGSYSHRFSQNVRGGLQSIIALILALKPFVWR